MIEDLVFHLQSLSFVKAAILVPGGLGAAVLVLPWLRNKFGLKVAPEVSDGLAEGFSAISLFFVFIAAVCLATVQTHQREGAKIVEKEVAHLTALDRDLVRIGTPESDVARVALKRYAQMVVDDEWKLLEHGRSSDAVDHALGEVIGSINRISAQNEKQKGLIAGLADRLDAASESRDDRIEIAHEHLSDIYWGMIFSFVGLLVAISAFTQASLAKRATICGKMVALSFTLVMIVQTDGVFAGDVSVQPTAFVKMIKKMQTRSAESE
jgi:Protein of unknown function (DUF4239)